MKDLLCLGMYTPFGKKNNDFCYYYVYDFSSENFCSLDDSDFLKSKFLGYEDALTGSIKQYVVLRRSIETGQLDQGVLVNENRSIMSLHFYDNKIDIHCSRNFVPELFGCAHIPERFNCESSAVSHAIWKMKYDNMRLTDAVLGEPVFRTSEKYSVLNLLDGSSQCYKDLKCLNDGTYEYYYSPLPDKSFFSFVMSNGEDIACFSIDFNENYYKTLSLNEMLFAEEKWTYIRDDYKNIGE